MTICNASSNISKSVVRRGAHNVKRAIDSTIALIAQYPLGGRLAGEQGIRVLPAGRYPYLIYWTIEAGEAWIVHIRDGRRKPWNT